MSDRKPPRVSPESRSHIVAEAGGDVTLCGLTRSARRPTDGSTMAHWVQSHINGSDPLWCRACAVEYVKHPQAHWPVPGPPFTPWAG